MNFHNFRSTPMHCAVYYGYDNLIPLLFMYGIPTDIKNIYDHFPIDEVHTPKAKELLQKYKGCHIYLLQK